MHRAPIALWAGAAASAAIAASTTIYHYADDSRGLWIGLAITCATCAAVRHVCATVNKLRDELAEVRDLAEAAVIAEAAKAADRAARAEDDDDRPLATVYEIRLHDGQREAIVGSHNPNQGHDEIWAILNADDISIASDRHSAS